MIGVPWLDSFSVKRPSSGQDSEGNPYNGWSDLGVLKGTYGSATSTDIEVGGKRGQDIDAAIAMDFADVRPGDRISGLRSNDWDVIDVRDVRLHQRCLIRKVS